MILLLGGLHNSGDDLFFAGYPVRVPYALNESATIDGATPVHMLFKIYVPLSIPSLACLFLFQFVGHWNGYFDGLLYINDPAKQPLQTPTSIAYIIFFMRILFPTWP